MFNKIFIVVAIISMLTISCRGATTPKINLYPNKVVTSDFIGNGVQWSAYPHADSPTAEWGLLMTNAKWDRVFTRLDYMKPALVRVIDQANWRYLKGFDKNDDPVLDFTSPEVKTLEKLLNYCQKNNISVLLGEWGCPYQVHDQSPELTGKFSGANDSRWSNIIVRFLDYLINQKKFTCIKYYNLVNEPNGDWASTKGNWDEWSAGIETLKLALEKAGLADKISIAGPDVVAHYDNPHSQYTGIEWVSESVKHLNNSLGIFDIHAYTNYDMVRSGEFTELYRKVAKTTKPTGKPIIFSEIGFNRDTPANQARVKKDKYSSEDSQMSVYDFSYGIDMADALIQIMNAGYSSALAWALDDAMHTKDDKGERNQLKRWGFWNSLGTELCNDPEDEKIRPWFYTWSLMCRYFPAGFNIIKSDETGIDGLRLVAGMKNSAITIAIINNAENSRKLNLKLEGLTAKKIFKKYIYSEKTSPVDENGFPIPLEKGIANQTSVGLSVDIPANSFILYTTLDF